MLVIKYCKYLYETSSLWLYLQQKIKLIMKFNLLSTLLLATILLPLVVMADPGVKKKVMPSASFGAKGGLNMNRLAGDTRYDNDFKPGIVGGIFLSVTGRNSGIRMEALLKTTRLYQYNVGYRHVRTRYIDFPILFEYIVFNRVHLHGGPVLSALVRAERGNGVTVKNDYNNVDFMGCLGVELDLPLHLNAGLRLTHSLMNANNTKPAANWINTGIQLTVGYRLVDL